MSKIKWISILIILMLLSSCNFTGEEVGRLDFKKVSTQENLMFKSTEVSMIRGEKINFWSEMDIRYEGEAALRFRIEILKDDLPYGALEIDPFEKKITLNEKKNIDGKKVEWRSLGKNASLTIDESGNYSFRAYLVASENSTLQIAKATLILKK